MVKWIKRGVAALLVLCVVAVAAVYGLLRASLPRVEGDLALPGLSAPVTIQRDAQGTATIEAANETDAVRALGYVHGQERFFEMDLLRRAAAGELSALFGARAIEADKRRRVHRLRARVESAMDRFAGPRQAQLQAYADGVNAGLAGLSAKPWAYWLLGQTPASWRPSDSALTGYAMYFDLQDSAGAREWRLWNLKPHLPPVLYDLLVHGGSEWDAPLIGAPIGNAVLPGADRLNLANLPMPSKPPTFRFQEAAEIGSNNFAVAGTLTRDGRAIVADDMHLGLRAPALWFRARLRYPDARAPGGRVDLTGFSLPGLPTVIAGSNGHVAWGFTNTYADTADWARIACPAGEQTGACRVTTHEETISVAGAAPVKFAVKETPWGPVLRENADGSLMALRWVPQLPSGMNVGLADLAYAKDLDQAMQLADRISLPAQNFMVADAKGRIGWRVIGALPDRTDTCDNATPRTIDSPAPPATCGAWDNRSTSPARVVDPPSGRLWTANSRTVDGEALRQMGDGGYTMGARAHQIRDDLFAKQRLGERDLLDIQLDDRAVLLQRWWKLLQDEAARLNAAGAPSPALQQLAEASRTWEGRATPSSSSYLLVRSWRLAVFTHVVNGLTAPAQAALGDQFEMPSLRQFEGVVWPLVTQRPANLAPRREGSWDALFEAAARDVHTQFGVTDGPDAGQQFARHRWGQVNTASICHPLASALPAFARSALCMPFDELPGDSSVPRVQRSDFGASERMVVSPGREADGIVQMPGGQSGHPLSPFWGAGHEDWVQGRPSPFLPGETRYTLKLTPAR